MPLNTAMWVNNKASTLDGGKDRTTSKDKKEQELFHMGKDLVINVNLHVMLVISFIYQKCRE